MKNKNIRKVIIIAITLFLSVILLTGNVKAATYSRESIKTKFDQIRNTSRIPCK